MSHPHPNIHGRERELRALSDAVRRIIAATVTNDASRDETLALAREAEALAERLEARVPETPPPRYGGMNDGLRSADHIFPYDVMLGPFSPLALPIELHWRNERAVGSASFTTPYEGPPGCVHGAVIAGAFDQVFNVANILSGTAGPTRKLELHYRRPTPLHTPVEFEGWVAEVDERSIVSRGVLPRGPHHGGVRGSLRPHLARAHPEPHGETRRGGLAGLALIRH